MLDDLKDFKAGEGFFLFSEDTAGVLLVVALFACFLLDRLYG